MVGLAMWWFAATKAWAQVPREVRPVILAEEAPRRYAAWRARKGLPPADLSCTSAGPPGILVCFRLWEDGVRRWVHTADLGRWNVTVEQLRQEMGHRAMSHLSEAEWRPVEGTSERYLQLIDGDGWSAAGVLVPSALVAKLGHASIRVAVPAQGVLVAYPAGSAELDRIMAVGVRELFDQQRQAVSPMVFAWDAGVWRAFGQAVVPD